MFNETQAVSLEQGFSTFFASRHPSLPLPIFGGILDAKIGLEVNKSDNWWHP